MTQEQRYKIYLMIGSGGLVALAFFLTIPLIGLNAIDQFKVSVTQAGLLASLWPATVFVCSFFVGRLADRWGYLAAMKTGNGICALSFLLMATTSSLPVYIATLILFGIGKSLSESSGRAAIASMSSPAELAKFMRLRYVLINVVCVGGPFLGFVAYKEFAHSAFLVSGILYGIVFLICWSMLKREDFNQPIVGANEVVAGRFNAFLDSRLQLFVLSGTLIAMAYGSFETIMPLVTEASKGLRPNFGILSGINAVTVVLSQIAILRWGSKISNRASVLAGFGLMVIGFLFFSIPAYQHEMSLVAVILFSLGESFLFPSFEIVLNDIAPASQRAAFFAAAETKQVGYFLGPSVSGLVFDHGGEMIFFLAVPAMLAAGCLTCLKILGETQPAADPSLPKASAAS